MSIKLVERGKDADSQFQRQYCCYSAVGRLDDSFHYSLSHVEKETNQVC